jgi:hypothetical protein
VFLIGFAATAVALAALYVRMQARAARRDG